MGAYASQEQIQAELAGHADLQLPSGNDLEKLIEAGQRAVDRRLGPLATDPVSGLKLSPILLTIAQRAALARAVAIAVGHLALSDAEVTFGTTDFLPEQVRVLPTPAMGELLDAELAGHGLIARSGCVLPDPDPLDLLA